MLDLERIAADLQYYLRRKSPKDTGNMADGIKVQPISDTEVQVIIGKNAPYAVYTNEPWISPYWKGKPNPNEGWIDKALDEFTIWLANKLNGEVTTISSEEGEDSENDNN